PRLAEAIALCQASGAILIVAKIDRLSRSASFLMSLKDSGLPFVAADMPELTTLGLGILATVAQVEAEAISARTRAPLAGGKARGHRLGNPKHLTPEARRKGAEAMRRLSRENIANRRAAELALLYRNAGLSLREIADKLNAGGHSTPRQGKRPGARFHA